MDFINPFDSDGDERGVDKKMADELLNLSAPLGNAAGRSWLWQCMHAKALDSAALAHCLLQAGAPPCGHSAHEKPIGDPSQQMQTRHGKPCLYGCFPFPNLTDFWSPLSLLSVPCIV